MTGRLRREEGMVLLLVLVVVVLLSALLSEFAFSTLVDLRLTETFRDSTRAYYLAKGGLRVGQMILQEDRNAYDGPGELWSQGLDGYPVGDDGLVSIHIDDLGGKLDLNQLVTMPLGNPDAVVKTRFLRLFKVLGLEDPEGLVDALIDWLDPDDEPQPYGAEDEYYLRLPQPYVCKNNELQTVEELLLVRGFTPEILRVLAPHVTVYGDKKINVNTATVEVLYSLAEEMDLQAAETIVEARNDKPIQKVEEIQELPGMNQLYWAINTSLSVTSSTYLIESWAGVNDGARRVSGVVDKTNNRLLFFKVM